MLGVVEGVLLWFGLSGLVVPELIVVTGTLMALGVVGAALRRSRRHPNPLRTVQGYATPQILHDAEQRPAYYVWVKGRQLRVSVRIFRRIEDGQRYEITYTPHTQQVVSARRIG